MSTEATQPEAPVKSHRAASSHHWSTKSGFKDRVALRLTEEEWEIVDSAWRYFWAKRKFDPPPSVSSKSIGVFNLPSRPLDSWLDLRFGKGEQSRRRPVRRARDDDWNFEGHLEE